MAKQMTTTARMKHASPGELAWIETGRRATSRYCISGFDAHNEEGKAYCGAQDKLKTGRCRGKEIGYLGGKVDVLSPNARFFVCDSISNIASAKLY